MGQRTVYESLYIKAVLNVAEHIDNCVYVSKVK